MIAWLKCLFLGHVWEARFHPPEIPGCERAYWEGWAVCLLCGKDSRPMEAIMDDNYVTMERIQMEIRARKL